MRCYSIKKCEFALSFKCLFFRKKSILSRKEELAKIMGVSEDRILIKFTDQAYTTRDDDYFISGNSINKRFIRNQNSKFMRDYARKYSLVGIVSIVDSTPSE